MNTTRTLLALVLVAPAAACRNEAPVLKPIGPQRAAVNVELVLTLGVEDPEGRELAFGVSADDLPDIASRSRFTGGRNGTAAFRWTPILADVGQHVFTFTVGDGRHETSRQAVITVNPTEGQGAPSFVQPLGSGTTLDLARGPCLDVPLVVADPDTPGVTLSQGDPIIDGAELVQEDGLTGTWTFCPTRDQIASGDRYAARFVADDFEHQPVVKDYLVVLLGDAGASCPGAAPTISHMASDWTTVGDLEVTATVVDPEGLKFEPLLYYSTTDPGSPPDLTTMVQLTMEQASGSVTDGQWTASIPNPVAGDPEGTSTEVFYVVSATDNDDAEGSCDHTTLAPEGGAYTATVTNGGGSGDKELCDPCTADAQCGGSGDLCVVWSGEATCFTDCEVDADCPSDHYCSFTTFTSVDGASGRQCLPVTLDCDAPSACDDDGYEPNDSLLSAEPIALGTHSLVSCTDDEDWYEVDLSSEGDLEAILDGGTATDLDLAIYDWWGVLLDYSDSLSSLEAATACVPPGDYLVRVYAWGSGDNDYDLDLAHVPGSCGAQCVDDGNEPDDDFGSARTVDLDLGTYRTFDQQVCGPDEDWYEVYLFGGEDLWVTLDFVQSGPDEDLDLMVVDSLGYILEGCLEYDPLYCDPLNGQSGSSDELLYMPVSFSDAYYVIVRGWDGASNDYDLCIGLDWLDCP